MYQNYAFYLIESKIQLLSNKHIRHNMQYILCVEIDFYYKSTNVYPHRCIYSTVFVCVHLHVSLYGFTYRITHLTPYVLYKITGV